jgi:hypothetical protein
VGEENRALDVLNKFAVRENLTRRIFKLESGLSKRGAWTLGGFLKEESVDDSLLAAAFEIKRLSAQIDVIIHALGILISLPHILEPDEIILSVSLGAGNTGRAFDLETDKRVAEFTFIQWQGGAEPTRQNKVFVDLFNLVRDETDRKKKLYVLDSEYPLRFFNNKRAIKSVLEKHGNVSQEFFTKYGDRYRHVSEYFRDVQRFVEIVDLRRVVPALATT